MMYALTSIPSAMNFTTTITTADFTARRYASADIGRRHVSVSVTAGIVWKQLYGSSCVLGKLGYLQK